MHFALGATVARKLAAARRKPAFVLLWLAPAWLLIGLSAGLIALVPFRRIAPWLGVNRGAVAIKPAVDAQQQQRALRIAQTIRLAARHAPFRADCFPQALAARLLCALWRVPCAVHLGVAIGDGPAKMRAHAWVSAGEVIVSGGAGSFAAHTPVACFVPDALRDA
ncbi:lasso peptide biosynthesis B2 protein [Sphingomonas sp. MS122]|uniref:lasso peptide biosynthesis B2 protein n=1 Tax=Sphingomonas sp. MS122 TaxID=3412683 RepID=UPI003C2E459A